MSWMKLSLTVLKTTCVLAPSRPSPIRCSQEVGVRSGIVTTSSSTTATGLGSTSTSLFRNFLFFFFFSFTITEVAILGDDVPLTCTPRSYRHSLSTLFFYTECFVRGLRSYGTSTALSKKKVLRRKDQASMIVRRYRFTANLWPKSDRNDKQKRR